MTAIKKIVLKGFKSFAKRTEVQFEPNFNIILGPNGSGKSNVCDALCFVLGKTSAKVMRAEKSANLIFNGGKTGKPAKEAEVNIFFDNKKKVFPIESKEVKISRIVKHSGISTYKINDEVRTRQQIVELLNVAKIYPDGHNITLQGDINYFIDMKTTERRELIEEVAGISVFEDRKQKALGELEKVQEKLNEADIILTERQKILTDLKNDRNQAIKYKELEKNVRRNKATNLNLKIKNKEEKVKSSEAKLNSYNSKIQNMHDTINQLKEQAQQKKEEIQKISEIITSSGDVKQKEINQQIDELKTWIITKNNRKETCEAELKKIEERKKQLLKELETTQETIANVENKKKQLALENENLREKEAQIKQQISNCKQTQGIQNLTEYNAKLESIEKENDEKQKLLIELQQQIQDFARQKDQTNLKLEDLDKKISEAKKLKLEDEEKLNKLSKLRLEFKEILKNLTNNLNENSVLSTQLENSRTKLLEANEKLANSKAKLGLTSVDRAVKKIKSSNVNGVYGTVSELANVNAEYALALEVAAGHRIKSIVVSTDEVAAKCIKILKESKSGVATFLPLNKLREKKVGEEVKNLLKGEGVIDLATSLVSYNSKFEKVFKHVFGSTIIVKDMAIARMIGVGRARMVTLEGELLEVSGAMVGGYRTKTRFGFKEKELSDLMPKLNKEVNELNKKISLIEKKKTENEETIMKLRETKAVLENKITNTEKTLSKESINVGNLQNEMEETTHKIRNFNQKIEQTNKSAQEITQQINNLRNKRQGLMQSLNKIGSSSVQELDKIEEEKNELREKLLKNEAEIKNLGSQHAIYYREGEKTRNIIKESAKESENFKKEVQSLKEELKDKKILLKQEQKKSDKFYKEYQHLFNKKIKIGDQARDKETQTQIIEERIRNVEDKRNDTTNKKAETNAELAGLQKEFEEYKEVPLRRNISLEELNDQIRKFEIMIKDMGNVNLRALEIYEKADEECKKLFTKYEKLKLEKEDVLKLMYEIESKKKDSFMRTFHALARNFKEIFLTLTDKGEAHIYLENKEDPFDGGVNMEVRIAYNKFLDIKSLSGGEKTLAALAFIFAIQEHSPASFYILDEVDAALDKRNSELLSKLINKYSNKAQYIIISHNDSVITEANAVYGVSMQDSISRIVSLKI